MGEYVIYARKSTESEDRQVASIGDQIDALKSIAARRGVQVARIVEESKSAREPGRPRFNALMAEVNENRVSGILAWKLDRLARNPVDGGAIAWALSENRLREIVTPSRTYTAASDDRLMMAIEFGMARKYVDDLSDNVRRGLAARAQRGWFASRPPAGYTVDRNTRTVVPDPAQFHFIRRAFDLVLAGALPSEALRVLNDVCGYRTRPRAGCEGRPMSLSGIYKTLANPFYCGLIRFHGEIHKGSHEPMLGHEDFRRVQQLLGRLDRVRNSKHEWAYAGLIHCGKCGGTIVGTWSRGKMGKRYAHYHCPRRHGCHQPYIAVAEVDRQFADWLDRWTLPESVVAWYLETIDGLERDRRQTEAAARIARDRTRRSVERQLDTLTTLRLRNEVRDQEYTAQRELLLGQLASLDRQPDGASVFEPARATVRALNEAKSRFLAGGVAEKRAIILAACSNPRLLDRKLLIQAQEPFAILGEGSDILRSWTFGEDVRSRRLDRLLAWHGEGTSVAAALA